MKMAKSGFILVGLTALLSVTSCAPSMSLGGGRAVKSVEFTNTPAPKTDDELLDNYTRSTARVTYADGTTRDFPLSYDVLFKNTDMTSTVKGQKYAAGQLFDAQMNPIKDRNGDPVIAETADGTSFLNVGGQPYLVNHWEYDNILENGVEAYKAENWYSRMPMTMNVSGLKQGRDGKLSLDTQTSVDFSSVGGGWIFCAGGPTPGARTWAARKTTICTTCPVRSPTRPPQRA